MKWNRTRCESGHCVEVAEDGANVLLRSSTSPKRKVVMTKAEFAAFVQAVKAGQFD